MVAHLFAITSSFEDCEKVFKYTSLYEPSTTYIQRIGNKVGKIGVEKEDALLPKGCKYAKTLSENGKNGEVLAVLVDGRRCQVLENKKPMWKEVKVGGICHCETV